MEELTALVERARRGDLVAFERIVRRFQHMAHGYAYALLGDFHWAEDAAQEAFVLAYRNLSELREAAAFPGWLRKLVRTSCSRQTRRQRVDTVPLEEARDVAVESEVPPELHEQVAESVRGLPEHQRTATTLFYMGGYSQREIADFLGVPVTTVQKRLHDARRKLKERMLAMVEGTLKGHGPDERFSQRVIEELRSRPHPLQLPNHPVRLILEAIREALTGYEFVDGDEVVPKDAVGFSTAKVDAAYHIDNVHVLRTETTVTALQAAVGRKPPLRILTAGRVFRPGEENESRLCSRVFHQVDVLRVDAGLSVETMQETVRTTVAHVLGVTECRWEPQEYFWFRDGFELVASFEGREHAIAGCGMLQDRALRLIGLEPEVVGGFGFGMGLERLAMLKYGIEDVHELWGPPYVGK